MFYNLSFQREPQIQNVQKDNFAFAVLCIIVFIKSVIADQYRIQRPRIEPKYGQIWQSSLDGSKNPNWDDKMEWWYEGLL